MVCIIKFKKVELLMLISMLFFVGCSVMRNIKKDVVDNSIIKDCNGLVDYYFRNFLEHEFGIMETEARSIHGEVENMTINIIDYENKKVEWFNSQFYFDEKKRITSKYEFDKAANSWLLTAVVSYSDTSLYIKYFRYDRIINCIFNKKESEILIIKSDSIAKDTSVVFVDFSQSAFYTNADEKLKPFEGDSSVNLYSRFNCFGYIDSDGVVERGVDSKLIYSPTLKVKYSIEGFIIESLEFDSFKDKYECDELGNIISIKSNNGRALKSLYEFDEQRNWTKNITLLENGNRLDTAYIINRRFKYLK